MASAMLAASSASVASLQALTQKSSSISSKSSVAILNVKTLQMRSRSCSQKRLSLTKAVAQESQVDLLADESVQDLFAKTLAGSLFATLANTGSAAAAQEVMQIAEGDARPLILLVVLLPAVGWVLFNILKPALNQINKMRGAKSMVGALGLGAAASLLAAPEADAAQQIAQLAVDSRPLLLLTVLVPAVGWVLFNILKPALNQVNKMKGAKSVAGAVGLGAAASLLAAPQADAAQEVAQLAADARPLILLVVLLPAVGWVLFNILQPALRQVGNMIAKNSEDNTPKKRR